RYGRDRLPPLAAEVEILDPLCLRLPAVAADERVVEVLALRAHAADVERKLGLERVPQRLHVVRDEHAHGCRELEAFPGRSAARTISTYSRVLVSGLPQG